MPVLVALVNPNKHDTHPDTPVGGCMPQCLVGRRRSTWPALPTPCPQQPIPSLPPAPSPLIPKQAGAEAGVDLTAAPAEAEQTVSHYSGQTLGGLVVVGGWWFAF